jgi:hypothetical protein
MARAPQTPAEIEAACDRLIVQAQTMPPRLAAAALRDRARRAHRAIYRLTGNAMALAAARERLDAEAQRLFSTI